MTTDNFKAMQDQIDSLISQMVADDYLAQPYSKQAEIIIARLTMAKMFMQNCIDMLSSGSVPILAYHEIQELSAKKDELIKQKDEEIKQKNDELNILNNPIADVAKDKPVKP